MDLIERTKPHVLSVYRAVIALLFVFHGTATLFGFMGQQRGGAAPELGAFPSWWAATIQLVAGGLVLVGLGTRYAALLCSGSMAYAYFVHHAPDGLSPLLNGGEASALFSWSFLLIAVFGPGKWALDTVLAHSRASSRAESGAVAVPA